MSATLSMPPGRRIGGTSLRQSADRPRIPGRVLAALFALLVVPAVLLHLFDPETLPIRRVRISGEFLHLAPAELQRAAEDVVREVDRPFDPLRHVAIHVDRGQRPFFVHSHGMEKFGHPDFELHGVPRASLDVARRLVRHLVAAVVSGGHFSEGETTQLCGFSFSFSPSEAEDPAHFSHGSLRLGEFKLISDAVTPEMEGMLVA